MNVMDPNYQEGHADGYARGFTAGRKSAEEMGTVVEWYGFEDPQPDGHVGLLIRVRIGSDPYGRVLSATVWDQRCLDAITTLLRWTDGGVRMPFAERK